MESMCISSIVLVMTAIMFCPMLTIADNLFIGVCYGTQGDNLPPAAEVVAMYEKYGIGRIRIYDPNPFVLEALKGSHIRVTIGVEDKDLQKLASSKDAAESWFAVNMQPYMDSVNFEFVVVGNQVIPEPSSGLVAAAMKNLLIVLRSHNLPGVRVTTSVNPKVLLTSYPPSASEFDPEQYQALAEVFKVLSEQELPVLMVNLYPYFAYAADPVNINLDFVLFNGTKPGFRDGELEYYNMLDAMVDAFYWAMEKTDVGNIDLLVSESGWPSAGNGNFTTPELALTYNKNFINQINLAMVGTPKRPDNYLEGFVFAMVNENLKPVGIEQNWGLFYPNKEPVYPLFS